VNQPTHTSYSGTKVDWRKRWARANPEKIKAARKRWKLNNPDKVRAASRKWAVGWHQRNKELHKKRALAWKRANREKVRERARILARRYRATKGKEINARKKQWRLRRSQEQVQKDRIYRREYSRRIFATHVNHKIALNLRRRIYKLVRTTNKSRSMIELLGCSVESFKSYIEGKFQEGMDWQNYGRLWHLDHILPCAMFDLANPEHQNRCFHFSNYQPLWASENIRKRNKIPYLAKTHPVQKDSLYRINDTRRPSSWLHVKRDLYA